MSRHVFRALVPVAVCVYILCQFISLFDVVDGADRVFHAWKYQKEANGQCYIHRYNIDINFGDWMEEPLQNYAPFESYPIDCIEGYTHIGMNLINRVDGLYQMAVCFYVPARNQGYCRLSDDGFANTTNMTCNVGKSTVEYAHFYIKADKSGALHSRFLTNGTQCSCLMGRSSGKVRVSQYNAKAGMDIDAATGTDKVFPFGDFCISRYAVDKTNYYFGLPVVPNSFHRWFSKQYDYINVESPLIKTPAVVSRSFVGFRYEKLGEDHCCIVGYNVDDTSIFYDFKAPCYNSTKQGYNVQWIYGQKTAYLKVCFMVNDTLHDYRLVCHRFGNGVRWTDYEKVHSFGTCSDHFKVKKPVNIVIGDVDNPQSAFKEIRIETSMEVCILDYSAVIGTNGNPVETLVPRGNSLAYDPVRNKVIKHEEDGTVEGVRIYAPRDAKLYSLGQHTIVKCCGIRWYVIKDGKYETRENWWYDYVVDQVLFMTLVNNQQ